MKIRKRIIICSLLLFGILGLGVTYLVVTKRHASSQNDDITIEVKRYDYSDSQSDHADVLQYEDSTEDFYEYEIEGNDAVEIEVKKHEYTP